MEPTFCLDWPSAIVGDTYEGPRRDLLRSGLGTALLGSLPALSFPAENASYSMTFYGPVTNCQPASINFIPQLEEAVEGCDGVLSACGIDRAYNYSYISWIPDHRSSEVPFDAGNPNGPSNTDLLYGTYGESPIEIFVASRRFDDNKPLEDWTVLNCSLYNGSYKVDFNFTGREQHVAPRVDLLNSINVTSAYEEGFLGMPVVNYLAMMDMLSKVLSGYVRRAIDVDKVSRSQIERTQVLEAYLAWTTESIPVFEAVFQTDDFRDIGNYSLAGAIEELFVNMTLSLFQTPEWWLRNQSSTTNVLTNKYYNIYVYNWQKLVFTYSIAITLTSLAVIIGLITIFKAGNSYSNKFSTIVRTTRSEELDALIDHHDRVGADPLSDRLRQAKLWVGNASSSSYHVVNPDSELQRLNYHANSEVLSMKSGISYVSRY